MVLLGRSPHRSTFQGYTTADHHLDIRYQHGEPVYGITVRRLVEPDCVQLIFSLPPHAELADRTAR